MLLGSEYQTVPITIKEDKAFVLPKANKDMRRVYAYLMKKRFIDRDVITYFARNKTLYEDAQYHNAVFVGLDENGIPAHAHKKATSLYNDSFRGNVRGSKPKYSFDYIGSSETLYVFEAPIDMLSFISLQKEIWQKHSYVSLCGVAEHAMLYQLKRNPHISTVTLCLDNDKAGIESMYRLSKILRDNDIKNIRWLKSDFKDWNEYLKNKHGANALRLSEHLTIEIFEDVCKSLSKDIDDAVSPYKPLYKILQEYKKIYKFSNGGEYCKGKEQLISNSSYSMAITSLQYAQEKCKIIKSPMTGAQIIEKLFSMYDPNRDKGQFKIKLADLKLSLDKVLKENDGEKSESQMKIQIENIMHLTIECVKVYVFAKLNLIIKYKEDLWKD